MKIKKLLSVLAVCLLMVATYSFSGCGEFEGYERTELEKAYESGYVTEEHLKSIAYYFNNQKVKDPPAPDFELIPKKKLSKSTEKKIKKTYLKRPRVADDYRNDKLYNVIRYEYFGTYNGYAVVFMMDGLNSYHLNIEEEKEIGGATFKNYYNLYAYYIGK